MTLGTIIERMADNVALKVIIGEYDNIARVYTLSKDFSLIFDYLNCEVTTIDTSEDCVLIVTVKEELKY